jgi:hypothetical protein
MDGCPLRILSTHNSPLHEFRVLDGLCIAFFWAAQYPNMLVFFVTIVTQED